ncbi:MAG: ribosome-associated translation inhibitor RaiA [Elusimicrobiota bacterium]
MQIHTTARHTKLTPAISAYLAKRIARLERYFDHLVWANVILNVEKHRHNTEIIIHSPLHTIRAKAEAHDLYSSIDLTIDKAEVQLKKLKTKWDHKRGRNSRQVDARNPYAQIAIDEVSAMGGMGQPYNGGLSTSITVVKKVPIRPTTVDEAIQTMESMGYNFWMFMNKVSKRINVIFRRADQTYGIMEPAKR